MRTRRPTALALCLLCALALVLAVLPGPAAADGCVLVVFNCAPSRATPAPVTPLPPPPAKTGPTTGVCPPVPFDGRRRDLGVSAFDVVSSKPDERDCALNSYVKAGVGVIRTGVNWAAIEQHRGKYDFAGYDNFVGALAQRRLHVLCMLLVPPKFYARSTSHGTYPPRNPRAMARFARAMVTRYGPEGTFWAAHPDIPKVPIRAWQVWNEPNLPVYWRPRPDPAAYARLLRTVGATIHQADPGSSVVSAGLPYTKNGVSPEKFVAEMARQPLRGSVDGIALHPYAPSSSLMIKTVRHFRRVLDRARLHSQQLWLTEFGWASDGPASVFTVGKEGQASRIRAALPKILGLRRTLRLGKAFYYAWGDLAPGGGTPDFWGFHTGLVDKNGQQKPALSAFSDVVRRDGR